MNKGKRGSKRNVLLDNSASLASPARTQQLLARHGFSLKKSLGQNFLTDGNTLERIVAAAGLSAESAVLEIGPGAGALTQKLAENAGKVVAVEIDRHLLPLLAETLAQHPNTTVIHGDILKIDLAEVWNEHFSEFSEVSVVANLPYYITTPIVLHLLEQRRHLKQMVIMMQKEVADRITARPGTKDYGSLSVAVQYYCEARELLRVPRTVFIPPPNVDSTVLGLEMRERPAVEVRSEKHFFELVRASFTQRRKTLSNNLLQFYKSCSPQLSERAQIDALLLTCGIAPERRAETLSMAEFAAISDNLTDYLTS
jgi:16S rRNA (adenine1518-N6/adenine1519-N6)-dimethyltransferase